MSGHAQNRILYADVNTANAVQRLKFAGIRRYAEWRGMEAVMVPRAQSHGAFPGFALAV